MRSSTETLLASDGPVVTMIRAASTVMQYQVITTGQRLWASSVEAGLFECFVLSEKTNLDAARAPLLRDIAATGKIHDR